MNYETAVAITNEIAPKLIIDPKNNQMPNMLVVRKQAGAMPFSISLVSVDPSAYQPIPAQPATDAIPAVPATDDHPGTPEIPAQPAKPERTVEGQVAETERSHLEYAIGQALNLLPEPTTVE